MSDANGRGDAPAATGESEGWSTFETRIRRRRFERCLHTAEAALDSGDRRSAKEVLEEANALLPDAPEIRALERRLAERPVRVESPVVARVVAKPVAVEPPPTTPQAPAAPVSADLELLPLPAGPPTFGASPASPVEHLSFILPERRSGGVVRALLATAAIASFAISGSFITQHYLARPQPATRTAALSDTPAATLPTAPATGRVAPTPEPTPNPDVAQAQASQPIDREGSMTPSTTPSVVSAEPPVDDRRPSAPAVESSVTQPQPRTEPRPLTPEPSGPPQARNDAPVPAVSTPPPAVPIPGSPSPSSPVAAPAASAATTATRETAPAAVSPVPALPEGVATTGASTAPPVASDVAIAAEAARTAPHPAQRADETPQIRAVLARYEAAYNRLDANAASNVYAGVNRDALGRAFGGLTSQRLSLGLCDITIIGDVGGASCNGKARWEPKEGSGPRTTDRHWMFNLRRAADGWRIEQVVVVP